MANTTYTVPTSELVITAHNKREAYAARSFITELLLGATMHKHHGYSIAKYAKEAEARMDVFYDLGMVGDVHISSEFAGIIADMVQAYEDPLGEGLSDIYRRHGNDKA